MQKTRFSQKLSNLELWSLLTTYSKLYMIFLKNSLRTPKIQDGWDTLSLKSTWRHFLCWLWSDLDTISQTGAEWHVDCGIRSKPKPDVEFQYGGRLGEFHGMSSQSHLPHCRVLPLGEFTVMIPVPRATLQGVRIPSAILNIVFRHILFLFFKCS